MENFKTKTLMEVNTKIGGVLGLFKSDVSEKRLVRLEYNKVTRIGKHLMPVVRFYEFATESEALNFYKHTTEKNAANATEITKVGKL